MIHYLDHLDTQDTFPSHSGMGGFNTKFPLQSITVWARSHAEHILMLR